MKCERFCNYHCTTNDCPNIQSDIAVERYGDGIAEDMGFYRVKCKDCIYNDKRCTCDDCYFKGGEECLEGGRK